MHVVYLASGSDVNLCGFCQRTFSSLYKASIIKTCDRRSKSSATLL